MLPHIHHFTSYVFEEEKKLLLVKKNKKNIYKQTRNTLSRCTLWYTNVT